MPASKLDVHFSSASVEWYTPTPLLDRVVGCIGPLDMDPAADPAHRVPAQHHFTKEDDGLGKPWFGQVFLNPPYGKEGRLWVTKLYTHWERGDVQEAILLVPARTDTRWFSYLWRASSLCFVCGRLTFDRPDGEAETAPFPSVLAYYGPRRHRFSAHFHSLGHVLYP